MKFVIEGRLDGLNEYTKANRTNKHMGNKAKHQNQEVVKWTIIAARLNKVQKYPITLNIKWYEPNHMRDIDNITFATKFILDAMVECGIITDDSQKYVAKINHEVGVDRREPRIEVEIIEHE